MEKSQAKITEIRLTLAQMAGIMHGAEIYVRRDPDIHKLVSGIISTFESLGGAMENLDTIFKKELSELQKPIEDK